MMKCSMPHKGCRTTGLVPAVHQKYCRRHHYKGGASWPRGGGRGGKDPSQPLYVYIESESEDQFRTAIGHVIELLTKVKGEFMSQQR